jgi:hypothetical protein
MAQHQTADKKNTDVGENSQEEKYQDRYHNNDCKRELGDLLCKLSEFFADSRIYSDRRLSVLPHYTRSRAVTAISSSISSQ